MKRASVLLVVVAAFAVVGAAAFTTATIDRTAQFSVNSDDSAVVQLTAGEGATYTSGKLLFNAGSEQLNKDSTFTFGDSSNPTSTNAFTITNSDNAAHTFGVSLSAIANGDVQLTLHIDSDGDGTVDTTKTVTEGSTVTTNSVSATGKIYVVVDITTGSTTATNSGTITITAN